MKNISIGVDEVGRGSLAGPVFAVASTLVDTDFNPISSHLINKLNDSKKLSPKKRLEIFDRLKENGVIFGLGAASAREIDLKNVLNASLIAMARAIDQCSTLIDLHGKRNKVTGRRIDKVLVDGIYDPTKFCLIQEKNYQTVTIKQGDTKVKEISCASILAKVLRDKEMIRLDKEFPVYGLCRNKGYGTKEHIDAITFNGPCVIHRRSFAPILKR